MAELVSCATETKLCSVCGRSQFQTTFCKLVAQAVGTFAYVQNYQEERAAGPHIS
jgi:hypothetical protein